MPANADPDSPGEHVLPRQPISHDTRIVLTSLVAGFPATVISLILVWWGDYTPKVDWTLTVLIVFSWLGFSLSLRSKVVRPL